MQFRKARLVNCTNTALVTRVPTVTAPTDLTTSATAASAFLAQGLFAPKQKMVILPIGSGSDTNTMTGALFGWDLTPDGSLWVPQCYCAFTATLASAIPGVVATYLVASQLFANAIVLNKGDQTIFKLIGPASSGPAGLLVDLSQLGSTWYEVQVATNSSATDTNALVGSF